MPLSSEEQKEFYNRQARSLNRKYKSTYVCEVLRVELEDGLSRLQAPDLGDVLEIGCGSAQSLSFLSGRFSSYTGIDISQKQIEEARGYYKSCPDTVTFEVGDVKKLAFPENRFDTVMSVGCIHHIDDPFSAIKDMYRVLKPGGTVMLYEPSNHNVLIRFLRYLFKKFHSDFHEDEMAFYKDDIMHMLREAGFKDVYFMFQTYLLGLYSVYNFNRNTIHDMLFNTSKAVDQYILNNDSVPQFVKKQSFSFYASANKI